MSTPPWLLLLTFPTTLASKVLGLPLIPVGTLNVIWKFSGTLANVQDVQISPYEPRLLKPAKPPEVVPLKLPPVKVIPVGVLEAVVPATVISSAKALSEANAK